MSIGEQEINDLQQRGFRLLFEDQFRPLPPPREFPQELERRTIPPVQGRLLDQSTTPLYCLGWLSTYDELDLRYSARCESPSTANVRSQLRALWNRKFEGSEHDDYKSYAPEFFQKHFDGECILAILSNQSERHLKQSLDDDFVQAAMEFLEIQDPPKWIKRTAATFDVICGATK